jgi:hypothetical protein
MANQTTYRFFLETEWRSVFQVGTDPGSLAVGDFNGDDKLDLVFMGEAPRRDALVDSIRSPHLGFCTTVSVSFGPMIS